MVTTNQVEAAITRLRTARARLFDASSQRTAVLDRRARMQGTIDELNAAIAAARAEVVAATDALRQVLGQVET